MRLRYSSAVRRFRRVLGGGHTGRRSTHDTVVELQRWTTTQKEHTHDDSE